MKVINIESIRRGLLLEQRADSDLGVHIAPDSLFWDPADTNIEKTKAK